MQRNPDLLSRLERLEALLEDLDLDVVPGDIKTTDGQSEGSDTEDEECLASAAFPEPNLQIITHPADTGTDSRGPATDIYNRTPAMTSLRAAQTSRRPSIVAPRSRSITAAGMLPRRFELILSTTRVYSRVRHRGIDDATSITSTRTRGWSVLTGVSLARISVTSVINLPLSDAEVMRFMHLAGSMPGRNRRESQSDEQMESRMMELSVRPMYDIFRDEVDWNNGDFGSRRVMKELKGLIDNPPKSVFAQEVANDCVGSPHSDKALQS